MCTIANISNIIIIIMHTTYIWRKKGLRCLFFLFIKKKKTPTNKEEKKIQIWKEHIKPEHLYTKFGQYYKISIVVVTLTHRFPFFFHFHVCVCVPSSQNQSRNMMRSDNARMPDETLIKESRAFMPQTHTQNTKYIGMAIGKTLTFLHSKS